MSFIVIFFQTSCILVYPDAVCTISVRSQAFEKGFYDWMRKGDAEMLAYALLSHEKSDLAEVMWRWPKDKCSFKIWKREGC